MKHLIKKILREEADTFNDTPFLDNQRKKRETGGDELDHRIRVLMKSVQKIPNLETWMSTLKSQGYDKFSGQGTQYVRTIMQEIEDLPKWLSGDVRHFGLGEFAWMTVKTFFNNGGYLRDFSDKDDPLDLTPIIVYEVDAAYKQPMAEYGNMWGLPLGAESEDDASKMLMDNPHTWETDREMEETDDWGDTEVYEINRVETKELKFTKGVVGL